MIGIIAAVSENGVFSTNGKIPWYYPEDIKYFKETTKNSTVIMGRKTFESIGKPLPNQQNIVLSSSKIQIPGIETFSSFSMLEDDVEFSYPKIWFIGGYSIYEYALNIANQIHLTIVPKQATSESDINIKFPWINPSKFKIINKINLTPSEEKLVVYIYGRY